MVDNGASNNRSEIILVENIYDGLSCWFQYIRAKQLSSILMLGSHTTFQPNHRLAFKSIDSTCKME